MLVVWGCEVGRKGWDEGVTRGEGVSEGGGLGSKEPAWNRAKEWARLGCGKRRRLREAARCMRHTWMVPPPANERQRECRLGRGEIRAGR